MNILVDSLPLLPKRQNTPLLPLVIAIPSHESPRKMTNKAANLARLVASSAAALLRKLSPNLLHIAGVDIEHDAVAIVRGDK